MTDLLKQHCRRYTKDEPPMSAEAIAAIVGQVPGWSTDADHSSIAREFKFKNYYETMAFVNALAWIAHGEDHHPDIEVGYNRCRVRYTTHSIGGLSENDFICAARIDRLVSD